MQLKVICFTAQANRYQTTDKALILSQVHKIHLRPHIYPAINKLLPLYLTSTHTHIQAYIRRQT